MLGPRCGFTQFASAITQFRVVITTIIIPQDGGQVKDPTRFDLEFGNGNKSLRIKACSAVWSWLSIFARISSPM